MYRGAVNRCVNLLVHYPEGCSANCAYCGLAKKRPGTYRDKSKDCWDCDFYRLLRRQHGAAFSLPAFAMHLRGRDPEAFRGFCRENGYARSGKV